MFHLFFHKMFTTNGPTTGATLFEAKPNVSPIRLSPISIAFLVACSGLFSSIYCTMIEKLDVTVNPSLDIRTLPEIVPLLFAGTTKLIFIDPFCEFGNEIV